MGYMDWKRYSYFITLLILPGENLSVRSWDICFSSGLDCCVKQFSCVSSVSWTSLIILSLLLILLLFKFGSDGGAIEVPPEVLLLVVNILRWTLSVIVLSGSILLKDNGGFCSICWSNNVLLTACDSFSLFCSEYFLKIWFRLWNDCSLNLFVFCFSIYCTFWLLFRSFSVW